MNPLQNIFPLVRFLAEAANQDDWQYTNSPVTQPNPLKEKCVVKDLTASEHFFAHFVDVNRQNDTNDRVENKANYCSLGHLLEGILSFLRPFIRVNKPELVFTQSFLLTFNALATRFLLLVDVYVLGKCCITWSLQVNFFIRVWLVIHFYVTLPVVWFSIKPSLWKAHF